MKRRILITAFMGLCTYAVNAQTVSYLTKVWEYCPAPGQFIHELPAYEPGDDAEAMAKKCLDNLYHDNLVCLGAYGGYMTVGFDHKILNIEGQKDLLVYGNANKWGTSAEPGIVLVSADTNNDGIPNDEWYELAGSEYDNPATLHNYEITYTRPASDDMDVPWTDNRGGSGVVKYMGLVAGTYNHQHAHYPKWIQSNTLTFRGARLPDNGALDATDGIWKMKAYEYGYADNQYSEDGCSFDIDWAVDNAGGKVHLESIDFVRIYTAVNQHIGGGVGEISTEISGVQDLHPTATAIHETAGETPLIVHYQNNSLTIGYESPVPVYLYNMQGALLRQWQHEGGTVSTPLNTGKGIYILQIGNRKQKVFIK